MEAISEDLNAYGFSTDIRVRLSETDAVGIVFFGSFTVYLDVGRMDYLAHLGLTKMGGAVRDLIPGAVVQQACNYYQPARYNDTLVQHTRIAHIGRSSYTFHFLTTNKHTRGIVSKGMLKLVWLDDDFRPMRVPDAFRETVRAFEGEHLTEPDFTAP